MCRLPQTTFSFLFVTEKGPGDDSGNVGGRKWKCGRCGSKDSISVVTMPSVYRYLANELAAMNIKSVMKTR